MRSSFLTGAAVPLSELPGPPGRRRGIEAPRHTKKSRLTAKRGTKDGAATQTGAVFYSVFHCLADLAG